MGWTECGDDFDFTCNERPKRKYQQNGSGGSQSISTVWIDTDLHIIPITLNWKLERQLASRLNFHLGAGIAIADLDVSGSGLNGDDSDVVFFGQVFGGLVYNVTESFELFGVVRGIYMDEPDLKVGGEDLGGRVLETDLLIEGGGRMNF